MLYGCCSVTQSCLTLCDPWTVAPQTSLSLTISWSLLKLMAIESVMPSNHLILCRPLLLPLSTFPSVRVFSNESVLRIRRPKYWSFNFNISLSNEYSGLISFRIDWLDLLVRESIPRQVDKKSGGSPRREGSGILKEEERTNFFSSTFLRII